uniref:Uncharacterized protein n=1 Tax=Anguilla anguilla TaxID=7936 RepID=A0A0E9TWJ5_ANGAN
MGNDGGLGRPHSVFSYIMEKPQIFPSAGTDIFTLPYFHHFNDCTSFNVYIYVYCFFSAWVIYLGLFWWVGTFLLRIKILVHC